MPRVKNLQAGPLQIIDIYGHKVPLAQNIEMDTYFPYVAITDVLEIVSTDPLYNPILVRDDTIAGTSDTHTINAATKKVQIINNSYSLVNVFRGSTSNTPSQPLPAKDIIEIDVDNYSINLTLAFTADVAIVAGDITIVEFK